MSAPTRRGPVVVVGDALLDVDLTGHAGRLAPDAPVPVLDQLAEEPRPGGAALAAALAAASGAETVLVTGIAQDADAERLVALLHDAGVRLVGVPHDGTTTVKRRVRADGQSLLRLDSGRHGRLAALPDEVRETLADAGAVLVSDYGRGLTEHAEIRSALGVAARRVPLVWDPHPRGGVPVPGARLVTPNRDEAVEFAARLSTAGDAGSPLAELADGAAALVAGWRAHAVAITLGPRGALLSHGEASPSVVPAPTVVATDPCGAGDMFAAAATVALAGGAVVLEAVQAAVQAAAAFVADGGAAAYRPPVRVPAPRDDAAAPGWAAAERVRAAGGTVVATGGCFDLLHAGHVATLEAARSLGDCLVVCLNSDASVRRLKGPSRPLVPQADRARVLAALSPVDAVVVFDEDTPTEVLRRIRPDVWAKGGDYAGSDLPEAAVLREWGGQAVVLPYLRGRSTTSMVTTAAARAATP